LDEITIRKKRKLFPGSPLASPVLFALLLKAFLEPFSASPPTKFPPRGKNDGREELRFLPWEANVECTRERKGGPEGKWKQTQSRFLRSLNNPFHFTSELLSSSLNH